MLFLYLEFVGGEWGDPQKYILIYEEQGCIIHPFRGPILSSTSQPNGSLSSDFFIQLVANDKYLLHIPTSNYSLLRSGETIELSYCTSRDQI